MAIRRFEDIQAWQEARLLVQQVYGLTAYGLFSRGFGLRDHIRRASVSVMANIAEGLDCESNIEFGRFLGRACRSAAEVQSLFYAALDAVYLSEKQFGASDEQAGKAKALISGFKTAMQNRN